MDSLLYDMDMEDLKAYVARARVLTQDGVEALRARARSFVQRRHIGFKESDDMLDSVKQLSCKGSLIRLGLHNRDRNVGTVLMNAYLLKMIDVHSI